MEEYKNNNQDFINKFDGVMKQLKTKNNHYNELDFEDFK